MACWSWEAAMHSIVAFLDVKGFSFTYHVHCVKHAGLPRCSVGVKPPHLLQCSTQLGVIFFATGKRKCFHRDRWPWLLGACDLTWVRSNSSRAFATCCVKVLGHLHVYNGNLIRHIWQKQGSLCVLWRGSILCAGGACAKVCSSVTQGRQCLPYREVHFHG
jgi:hypothetical protein